jgi:hypothetical protein
VETLQNTELAEPLDPWALNVQGTAEATLSLEENADGAKPAMRVDITTPGELDYEVQLYQTGLKLSTRKEITYQNWSVEAPVRQGATTKDWQRQCEEEQRRRTGWIDGPK